MEDFERISEEAVIEDALRAIPDYLERIRATGEFNIRNCVALETKRIEKFYRKSHGLPLYGKVGNSDLKHMDAYTAHFVPLLMERTLPIQQSYMRQRRISKINATAAQALIPAVLEKAGLKVEVSGQKYRAKVLVKLPGYALRFYVRYKDMCNEGFLEDVAGAVLQLKDAVSKLGYGAVVSRF